VHVRVMEAGREHRPLDVDRVGVRGNERANRGLVPDSQHAAAVP